MHISPPIAWPTLASLVTLVAVLACSEAVGPSAPLSPSGQTDGNQGQDAAPAALDTAAPSADASAADVPPSAKGSLPAGIQIGFWANLGDSVAAGCCTDGNDKYQYFKMLLTNDGSEYAAWAGHDLMTLHPGLKAVNWGKSGADSADVIAKQLPKFASSYGVPVLVTLHVGGNDFNDHDFKRFIANSAKVEADGVKLGGNIDEIAKFFADKQRFPKGAWVFVAYIFSPTDDVCTFKAKAGYNGKWCQALSTMGCLAGNWVKVLQSYNQEINKAVAQHPHAFIVDDHAAFLGHGLNHDDANNPFYEGSSVNYFNTDCVHPNAAGHHAIRATFFAAIHGFGGR